MNMVAKMRVKAISDEGFAERVKFVCDYDPSIPDDRRFNAATPNGECSLDINNQALKGVMKLGDTFYVTFSPVAGHPVGEDPA